MLPLVFFLYVFFFCVRFCFSLRMLTVGRLIL